MLTSSSVIFTFKPRSATALSDDSMAVMLGQSISPEQRRGLEARVTAFYRSMYPGYEEFRRELTTHVGR